ncbi:MAG: YidC/Oxa1 family membrane protein insertase [Candidatus Blackburnbacteria bacterium]|nr:YidC/Oxa1 family membrane protein insertase [Candidatus Blackburnbacteria bacterium]
MSLNIITQPLLNLLIIFYHLLFSDLGLAIIGFTAFIRLLLTPLTLPSMKMMQKMKEYNPELNRIKEKHKDDKKKLLQAQTDFYKEKGINPASGCLPQIVSIVILIALFSGFSEVFQGSDITHQLNKVLYPALQISGEVNRFFLGRDLTKPDVFNLAGIPFALPGVFLIVVAFLQFLSSKMMMPNVQAAEKVAKKTEGGADDFATSMQSQMMYMYPLITLFIGLKFPLGVVLYWGTFSLFQAVQQYFVSGWGGLAPWVSKIRKAS